MKGVNRYAWEAETINGELITKGGDLRGCVRVSLLPQKPGLPRHDIVALPFRKRFCRGFIQNFFETKITLPGKFFWKNGDAFIRTEKDLSADLKPGDVIGKGVAGDGWYRVKAVEPNSVMLIRPYAGLTKKDGFLGRKLVGANRQQRYYMHCIETAHSRIWVNGSTGAMLVTPRDFEYYL